MAATSELGTRLWEQLLGSAADAFLQVGVFVGAVLFIFEYIDYRQRGALVERIQRAAGWQPLIGALLGLTPGCGGAIFTMTLYLSGRVTFGTMVATLVATMGDSAFVLIAASPKHFVYVSLMSLAAAAATGYAVDFLQVGALVRRRTRDSTVSPGEEEDSRTAHHLREAHGDPAGRPQRGPLVQDSRQLTHIGHCEGDPIDLKMHHSRRGAGALGYRITHGAFPVYWVLLTVGLVFGVASLFGRDVGQTLNLPWLAPLVGVLGTASGVALMIAGRRFGVCTTHEDEEHKLYSLSETLAHGAMDTAFVTTWVFVSYLLYNVGIVWLGGGDLAAGERIIAGWMAQTGAASVVFGALLGLIPGCGPQIVFVAMFGRGLIPFAALFANAVSQDGVALFPLLALDRRSALWATAITTVPALILGLLIYLAETRTPLGLLLGQ